MYLSKGRGPLNPLMILLVNSVGAWYTSPWLNVVHLHLQSAENIILLYNIIYYPFQWFLIPTTFKRRKELEVSLKL